MKESATILAGLGALAYMTWSGCAQIYRIVSAGQLMASYGGGKYGHGPAYSKLISYGDAPLDFTLNAGVAAVMAGGGMLIWLKVFLRVQRWWNAGP